MIAAAILAIGLAIRGADRLTGSRRQLPLILLVSLSLSAAILASIALGPSRPQWQSMAITALAPFLIASAVVDGCSGWAPDELTIPICLLSGLASPWFAAPALGLLVGLALIVAGRIWWRCSRGRIMPPADALALALPFLILKPPWPFLCLAALAVTLAGLLVAGGRHVALLAIAHPIHLAAIMLDARI